MLSITCAPLRFEPRLGYRRECTLGLLVDDRALAKPRIRRPFAIECRVTEFLPVVVDGDPRPPLPVRKLGNRTRTLRTSSHSLVSME